VHGDKTSTERKVARVLARMCAPWTGTRRCVRHQPLATCGGWRNHLCKIDVQSPVQGEERVAQPTYDKDLQRQRPYSAAVPMGTWYGIPSCMGISC